MLSEAEYTRPQETGAGSDPDPEQGSTTDERTSEPAYESTVPQGEMPQEEEVPHEERKEESKTTPAENVRAQVKAIKLSIDEFFGRGGAGAVIVMCAAFLVFLESSIEFAGNDLEGYAKGSLAFGIASGLILMVAAAAWLVLKQREMLNEGRQKISVALIVLWTGIMAGILTFPDDAPFVFVGNGYFGTWVAFIAALTMLGEVFVEESGKLVGKAKSFGYYITALFILSIIEFCAALTRCADGCSSMVSYAISVGVASALICVAFAILDPKITGLSRKLFSLLLFLWWLTGVFVLTFAGPFENVGNGYFSTYIAFFVTVLLLHREIIR